MDATITYDEVAALIGVNKPMLEPRPNFEKILMLRRNAPRKRC
jgi:hypothetical protein